MQHECFSDMVMEEFSDFVYKSRDIHVDPAFLRQCEFPLRRASSSSISSTSLSSPQPTSPHHPCLEMHPLLFSRQCTLENLSFLPVSLDSRHMKSFAETKGMGIVRPFVGRYSNRSYHVTITPIYSLPYSLKSSSSSSSVSNISNIMSIPVTAVMNNLILCSNYIIHPILLYLLQPFQCSPPVVYTTMLSDGKHLYQAVVTEYDEEFKPLTSFLFDNNDKYDARYVFEFFNCLDQLASSIYQLRHFGLTYDNVEYSRKTNRFRIMDFSFCQFLVPVEVLSSAGDEIDVEALAPICNQGYLPISFFNQKKMPTDAMALAYNQASFYAHVERYLMTRQNDAAMRMTRRQHPKTIKRNKKDVECYQKQLDFIYSFYHNYPILSTLVSDYDESQLCPLYQYDILSTAPCSLTAATDTHLLHRQIIDRQEKKYMTLITRYQTLVNDFHECSKSVLLHLEMTWIETPLRICKKSTELFAIMEALNDTYIELQQANTKWNTMFHEFYFSTSEYLSQPMVKNLSTSLTEACKDPNNAKAMDVARIQCLKVVKEIETKIEGIRMLDEQMKQLIKTCRERYLIQTHSAIAAMFQKPMITRRMEGEGEEQGEEDLPEIQTSQCIIL